MEGILLAVIKGIHVVSGRKSCVLDQDLQRKFKDKNIKSHILDKTKYILGDHTNGLHREVKGIALLISWVLLIYFSASKRIHLTRTLGTRERLHYPAQTASCNLCVLFICFVFFSPGCSSVPSLEP